MLSNGKISHPFGTQAQIVNVQAGKKNPETTAPAFSDVPLVGVLVEFDAVCTNLNRT